ncbi:hypothetical protein BJZ21_004037 [Nocardioides panaciterrulae]|uniref:Uncharacterized protein n=1 Tax=Nocardioides panaciterrulae TaxID=661492 RepID=A0A7Y9EA17_9ACTN|nr:hypothetical protein [Nocardioides panaciterrulae]NYD43954.1 hypothetical protein [Nocardioides panaciterrulae]
MSEQQRPEKDVPDDVRDCGHERCQWDDEAWASCVMASARSGVPVPPSPPKRVGRPRIIPPGVPTSSTVATEGDGGEGRG